MLARAGSARSCTIELARTSAITTSRYRRRTTGISVGVHASV
jgi:hypothetical protein